MFLGLPSVYILKTVSFGSDPTLSDDIYLSSSRNVWDTIAAGNHKTASDRRGNTGQRPFWVDGYQSNGSSMVWALCPALAAR